MLTLFLVRHASHGLLDRTLAGRMPGVALSPDGRAEAARLAARLGREAVDRIVTSPLERARETAAILAGRRPCPVEVEVADAVNEIDCGEWTGVDFASLADDPRWDAWNRARAGAATPGGESMAAVQDRAMGLAARLLATGESSVAVVTHADVIKAMVAAVLGLSLDRHHHFTIDPASVTTVEIWGAEGRVVRLNEAAGA